MAVDELARGELVEVMESYRPPAMPISAVVPSTRLLPPRVRIVLDALDVLRQRRDPTDVPVRSSPARTRGRKA